MSLQKIEEKAQSFLLDLVTLSQSEMDNQIRIKENKRLKVLLIYIENEFPEISKERNFELLTYKQPNWSRFLAFSIYYEDMKIARQKINESIPQVEKNHIILIAPCGSGKTALVNEISSYNKERNAFSIAGYALENTLTDVTTITNVMTTDLLIIDEIGEVEDCVWSDFLQTISDKLKTQSFQMIVTIPSESYYHMRDHNKLPESVKYFLQNADKIEIN
jgi:DNA replication protein DnaC